MGLNSGTNEGQIILDLDLVGDQVDGHFYVFDNNPQLPGTFGRISAQNTSKFQALQIPVLPLNPSTNDVMDITDFHSQFNHIEFAGTLNLGLTLEKEDLFIHWRAENEVHGEAKLRRLPSQSHSTVAPLTEVSNWSQFREFALSLTPGTHVFRGQSQPWPLRTSFHRTRRKDIFKFITEDVPILQRRLSPLTKHLYEIGNPTHNEAFWNLIQHHGYPTPLLDWTFSPFVASYFAFRDHDNSSRNSPFVRIFLLDKKAWETDYFQVSRLTFTPPHFSVFEPANFENDRATPQQALMAASNMDDIEYYIQFREREKSKTYLSAIDLPISERTKVLSDLALMGISEASLFPGFDGVCAGLKQERF